MKERLLNVLKDHPIVLPYLVVAVTLILALQIWHVR